MSRTISRPKNRCCSPALPTLLTPPILLPPTCPPPPSPAPRCQIRGCACLRCHEPGFLTPLLLLSSSFYPSSNPYSPPLPVLRTGATIHQLARPRRRFLDEAIKTELSRVSRAPACGCRRLSCAGTEVEHMPFAGVVAGVSEAVDGCWAGIFVFCYF